MEGNNPEDSDVIPNVLERVSEEEIVSTIFLLLDDPKNSLRGVAHEGFIYQIDSEPRFQISKPEEKAAIRTKVDEILLILEAQGHIRSTMKPNSVGTPVRFWTRAKRQ